MNDVSNRIRKLESETLEDVQVEIDLGEYLSLTRISQNHIIEDATMRNSRNRTGISSFS